MIRVKVYKENQKIIKITFRGHAEYDVLGKDIVCAASSATILTSINGILSIDETAIEEKEKNNNIDIKIIKDNEIAMLLINNMLNSLKSIEQNYPKNIEIKEEE